VTEVSAPNTFIAYAPSDQAYVVGLGHKGYRYDESNFNLISGGTIE
jgi:hypothetical protein